MEDRFQRTASGVIVENAFAHDPPIEAPIGSEYRLVECLDDGLQAFRPGSDHLARNGVGVTARGAELFEKTRHTRFAGSDAAGQRHP
jgi:hypothetical protein